MLISPFMNRLYVTNDMLADHAMSIEQLVKACENPRPGRVVIAEPGMTFRRITTKARFGMRAKPRRPVAREPVGADRP